MNNYITGTAIKTLREKRGITQKDLADKLSVSDKTVSKWETGRGFPDVGLLEELAAALGISVAELLTGELVTNSNRVSNMSRAKLYVCPICGNVLVSSGEGMFSCCGVTLVPEIAEATDDQHMITAEKVDGELFVSVNQHSMTKSHYVSFLACITGDRIQLVKLYPEQSPECRFQLCGNGKIYAYCNRDGLFFSPVPKRKG